MNEEDKKYYIGLILLLITTSFISGILTHNIYFNKHYPSISITYNESSQRDIFNIKDLQKTNVVFFTNYINLTNYSYINYDKSTSNFSKISNEISNEISINSTKNIISDQININSFSNNVLDSDLDKISAQLQSFILEVQKRK